MFNKICIKSKKFNNQENYIAFLVETMLFYKNVIVIVYKDELKTLLNFFGEEFLKELIKIKRIDLRVCENFLGSMKFPNDGYNVNLMSNNESSNQILYQAHREVINNSKKNTTFADNFSDITKSFKYPSNVENQIKNDFGNETLLLKLLPIYLNELVPNFVFPEELEIGIIKDKSFGSLDAFSVNSNLDLDALNKIYKQNEPNNFNPIDYSGFFLSLAESKGDIFIASTFESELVTSESSSKFIQVQLIDIIQRSIKSQDNLNLFNEHILTDCHSIGDAFVNGFVTKKELLKLFEKADKFRKWLVKLPEDKSIINEYYKEVTSETFANKLPAKIVKFIFFTGLGMSSDIFGPILTTSLAAFDQFFLGKLVRGWKPNQFIDRNLKPLIIKKVCYNPY